MVVVVVVALGKGVVQQISRTRHDINGEPEPHCTCRAFCDWGFGFWSAGTGDCEETAECSSILEVLLPEEALCQPLHETECQAEEQGLGNLE